MRIIWLFDRSVSIKCVLGKFSQSFIWFFRINGAQSLLFTKVLQKLHVTWKLSCHNVAMSTVNTLSLVILLSLFNSLGLAIDKLEPCKRLGMPRPSFKFSYWHTFNKQNTVSFSDWSYFNRTKWLQHISNFEKSINIWWIPVMFFTFFNHLYQM